LLKEYIVFDPQGNQYGPADLSTLKQWVAAGSVQRETTIRDVATGERLSAGSLPELFPEHAAYYRPVPPPQRAFTGDVVVGVTSAIFAFISALNLPLGIVFDYLIGTGQPHERAMMLKDAMTFLFAVVPWLVASIGMIRSRQWSFGLGLGAAVVSMVITFSFWNAPSDPTGLSPQLNLAVSAAEIVLTSLFAFYCVLRLTGAVGPKTG
jgi:hypothetical protein